MTHAMPDPHDGVEFRLSHDRPLLGDDDEMLLAVSFVLRPDPGGASGGVDVHIDHSDAQPRFLPWEALELVFAAACAESIEHVRQTWMARIAEN